MAVYELLSGEPWCWTRAEINGHTDWYLWEVVIRPAVKKAEEFERKHGKGGDGRVGHGWEESERKLPSKEQYILVGERLGIPRDVSAKEYDKFLAARRAKRNGHRTG